ncbi:uncharacterized protein LOC120849287 [Ixodes scapularis]|uniref:uncharacterized protein LOC120849287 n=1 Tax=Ixodes scapularis TaxID=6945 RepID=UPI001A9D9DA2|nr:uncharacterized protein LOC120849287 [Ixodes scapularis]
MTTNMGQSVTKVLRNKNIVKELACTEQYHPTTTPRFKYLKSYLTGKAAAAIEGLAVTAENYKVAIDLLKERFGQQELIIESHLSRLLEIKPVHDSRSVNALRALYDEVETGVRSLDALGVQSDTYGTMLLTVLRKVVPADLSLEYNRRSASRTVTKHNKLRDFLDFLKIEIESRERSLYGSGHSVPRTEDQRSFRARRDQQSRYPPSASVLTTAAGLDENNCVFCKSGAHLTADCTSSMTNDERKRVLKAENRCYRCTKKNHRAKDCRSAKWLKCARCAGRHASVMCDPNFKPQHKTTVKEIADTGETSTSEGTTLQSTLKITNSERNRGKRVLLQTAQAWAEGERERCRIRLLIDGGSQRTFIRQTVSKRLHLKELGEEDLTIFTFGDAATKTKCKRVELWLRSQYDRRCVKIEALEVPHICSDVMNNPSEELRGLPDDMNLADGELWGNPCEEGISLLIGADHFWDIVNGSVKRLDGKLMAVDTILGWTLQGPLTSTSATIYSSATGVMRVTVSETNDAESSAQLRSFWEPEHIGIADNVAKTSETELLSEFKKSVKFGNERCQVSLPCNGKGWPGQVENACQVADNKAEEKKAMVLQVTAPALFPVFDLERYNSATKVIRVTAWIKRFVKNCAKTADKRSGPLSSEELIEAETYWLTIAQNETFVPEITSLREDKQVDRKSTLGNLNPFLDSDGLVRVGGRLQHKDDKQ